MKALKLFFFALSILLIPMNNILGQSVSKSEKRKYISKQEINIPNHNLSHLLTEYTFTKTTGTYTNLTNTISINKGELWDDFEGVIPVGFGFKFFDIIMDSVHFGAGLGGLVSTIYDEDYLTDYIIAPFEADLIDRGAITETSASPISYKLDGQAGNRILKIEWKNAGFFNEGDEFGTLNDFVNFQLWLYEGTNNIEIRFGLSNITDPELNYDGNFGPFVGIADLPSSILYAVVGDPEVPEISNLVDVLSGTAPNGTIYKFSRVVSSTENDKQNQNLAAQINPNPFHLSSVLTLKNGNLKNGELKITDINGRVVKTLNNLQSIEIIINRDNLINGVYFYSLTDKSLLIQSGKFIIE